MQLGFVRYRFARYRFVRCRLRFVGYRYMFLPSKYFALLQDFLKACLEDVFSVTIFRPPRRLEDVFARSHFFTSICIHLFICIHTKNRLSPGTKICLEDV